MPRRRKRKPAKKRAENAFYRGGALSDPVAHDAVEVALRDGVLVRPEACETCGKTPPPLRNGKCAIQAHHDDYNKPLDVRWLCKGCHFRWHQKHVAVPRRDDAPAHHGVPGALFDPYDGIAARMRSVGDDVAYLVMAMRL